jgi:tryptophanyl-tRNA synthetase
MIKRCLSGIKPTGDIHIGNYFGAIKQFVDMQSEYENFIFIADYHALNQINNPQILSSGILEIAKAYLATGLDPQKTILFRQSDIPQTTELCWIFNSITPYSLMKRAHAFKDAEAKSLPINMGLFDYPVLMASDILIYDSEVVPVGQDQKQHVEMAQDIARIFNNFYGETFKIPEVLIKDEVAIVKGLDGRKMSKSYNNTIGLFDDKDKKNNVNRY